MINEHEMQNSSIRFYEMINPTPATEYIFYSNDEIYGLNNQKKEFFSPQVTIVAIKDNIMIGYVFLHRVIIRCNDKIQTQLALSLYCIHPSYINQDIGSALIIKACEKATDMGYSALFLRGNPAYFSQFGFVPTHIYNLYHINDLNQKSDWCMVKELVEGYLENIEEEGKIEFE